MSTLKISLRSRVLIALIAFFVAVTLLVFLYGLVGLQFGGQSQNKWVLALFGPVLALFTHVSYLLFIPLAIPVVVLLCIAVTYPQARTFAAVGLVGTWLAIGWYLRDLF
jgi:hypothetical protein